MSYPTRATTREARNRPDGLFYADVLLRDDLGVEPKQVRHASALRRGLLSLGIGLLLLPMVLFSSS